MKDKRPVGKSGQGKSFNPFTGPRIIKAVPTSASQKEIWASLEMDPNATLCYNESLQVELRGKLHVESLKKAFQEVVLRHDSLSSVFSNDGSSMMVLENSQNSLKIEVCKNEIEFKKRSLEIALASTSEKFILTEQNSFKGVLLQDTSSEERAILFLSAHHIICDGWSLAVIVNEISVIYSSYLKGVSHNLPRAAQFCDYIIEGIEPVVEKKHIEYWKNIYQDIPKEVELPKDFDRPNFRTFNSKRIDKIVPNELTRNYKKWGAKNSLSFYVSLMGAFEILLHQLSGQEDIIVGISSADQSHSGKYDLVGHLVNLLPIRQKISSKADLLGTLKNLKSNMLTGMEHQNTTFGSLVNELNLERDASRIPLVNMIFNVDQQYPGQGLEFDGIDASYKSNPRSFENFEIFINATSCGDDLCLECQFNTDLYSESTIEKWLDAYIGIMNNILKVESGKIEDVFFKNIYIPEGLKRKSDLESDSKKIVVTNSTEEKAVSKIWESVLGFSDIPHDSNFFSLGGHSLLASEVINRINSKFLINLTLRDIFEAPTISELALKLHSGNSSEKLEIPKAGLSGISTPLSTAQFRAWYMEEISPESSTMHNLPASIRINGKVERQVLEDTMNYLVKRHESFRTYFVKEEGRPVQRVEDNLVMSLEEVVLNEEELEGYLNECASSHFNLEDPGLFKMKLIKLDENEFVFFFIVHHIIWDGWCFDIFFDELDKVYSSFIKSETVNLPKLPSITYRDFSEWQRQRIQKGDYSSQITYWKKQLDGELPVLEIPLDKTRPSIMSNYGATVPFSLGRNDIDHLKAYAKSQGLSLYNVCLGAFKLALHKVTQERDIIVGTPVRGRPSEELNNIIGYFVNTVALRTQIDCGVSLNKNLSKIMSVSTEAFGNQDIPFEKVLENVSYQRDKGRTPIYQCFFSYQDVSNRSALFNGEKYSQVNVEKASTHTDLDLWIKTSDEKLEGAFEYRVDLFEEISIKRFKELFLYILKFICSNGDKILGQESLLPPSQQSLLLDELNDTHTQKHSEKSFIDIFYQQVDKNPHSTALLETRESTSYTYEELDRASNLWANELILKGVKQGDLVGLATHRNNEMLVALLAILKTGAGYVPLDPGFPQDRLNYMVDSSGINLLVTTNQLESGFKANLTKLLISDLILSEGAGHRPTVDINAQSTAYVIYTSGSTGLPKGVELTHGSVINFLKSMAKSPGLGKSDTLLAVTTLSFDIAVLELYLPLICGANLFIASKQDAMDGHRLKSIIEENNVNVMQATPSTWRLLLSAGWDGGKEFKVLCGGEPFPKDLAKTLSSQIGEVWNMYGPTETTVWSTCSQIEVSTGQISIGRPIDNTTIYIVDEEMNLLPLGSTGSLFIGGNGLAKGYFAQQELTDEKFIKNPFTQKGRIYNTGDLARYHSDGTIECLGRNDGQVKVRGYRIELSEIEVVLSEVNSVEECVVITREDSPGDVRIVAYLITQGNKPISQVDLRKEIGSTLPSYMIPSHFVIMEIFPKTLNNKIDKKNLPSPIQITNTEKKSSKVVNNSSLKEEVKIIWKGLLGLEEINDDDRFFDIGGHSLIAIEMFATIFKRYNVNLSLDVFFKAESLSDFSAYLESLVGAKKPVLEAEVGSSIPGLVKNMVAIKPAGGKAPLFCFHGAGGNVLNYAKLSSLVEADRPIFGFQSPGVDGVSDYANSISELVDLYTTELLNFKPSGPFLLAGGSMGGALALEVGNKLMGLGHEVEKVIMFDTLGPNITLDDFSSSNKSFFTALKNRVGYQLERFLNRLKMGILTYTGGVVPHKLRYYFVEEHNYKLIRNHKISSFDGDVTLIRVSSKVGGVYTDPNLGWGKTVKGKISTLEINGDHEYFLESEEFSKAFASLFKKP